MKRRISPNQRFWRKVRIIHDLTSCWEWQGGRVGQYGSFGIGEVPGLPHTMIAHRFAYRSVHGVIPGGKGASKVYVLHKCDNPPCVRPSHLFLGTQKDNMGDAVAKGRNVRGERGGSARLASADVIAMRERYAAGGVLMRELANDYGVDPSHVSKILSRDKWAHV